MSRPRILAVRRSDTATFSVGDEAVIRFDPGLQQFVSLRDEHGVSIGDGGAFEWTIPVGAAGTAAYAVLEPTGFDGVNTWTGVTNTVRWKRACLADETLIATCRLAALSRAATLPYSVFSLERGDLLVEGQFVFVSVTADAQGFYVMEPRRRPDAPVSERDGRAPRDRSSHPPAPIVPEPAATDEPDWKRLPVWSAAAPPLLEAGEPMQPPLFRLRPPRILRTTAKAGTPGAIWEWVFPCDLLRLLGNPVGGAAEPLGRRHHPYGRILEGMGVHAALGISGGQAPLTLQVEWWLPTTGAMDFRLRSKLATVEAERAETTHDIYEGERPVGCARVVVGLSR